MTDLKKFEEMLERLVNEDKEGAEELFHEIVVEKSREIYQNIIESDDEEVEESDEDDLDEATDEEVDESDDEDLDESADEDLDEAEEEEVDESEDDDLDEMFGLDELDAPEMGDDETDNMIGDIAADMDGDDDEGDMDDEGEEGPEAAMSDLEDALDALKAEFEKMMGDEGDDEGEDEPEEEAMDMPFEAADEEVEEAADEEVEEAADEEVEESTTPKSAAEVMREYANKMADEPKKGDNGANAKSVVAGKNDMGGTASNIARGDTANDGEVGKGSKVKGSALNDQNPKEDNAGNRNVKGGTSAKSGMKNEPGHGAEKKGKPENADNKKSTIGS